MSDSLLFCCRLEIDRLLQITPSPDAGARDFCNGCGVDLIVREGRWTADLAESFGRIRATYAKALDAKPAAEAYQRLLTGAKAK